MIRFWGFWGFYFLLLLFVLNSLYMLLALLLYEISGWKRLGPQHKSYRPKMQKQREEPCPCSWCFRCVCSMHKSYLPWFPLHGRQLSVVGWVMEIHCALLCIISEEWMGGAWCQTAAGLGVSLQIPAVLLLIPCPNFRWNPCPSLYCLVSLSSTFYNQQIIEEQLHLKWGCVERLADLLSVPYFPLPLFHLVSNPL